MHIDIPFDKHRECVRAEWIDYSRHMNIGYYLLPFENASSAFCFYLDLSRPYRERTNHALFAAETHVTFEHEVREGAPLRFTTQLLDWAPKWINCFHCMYHAEEGFLAATNQIVFVHVDLSTRRSAPMPPKTQQLLAKICEAHSSLPMPPQAGRGIRTRGVSA